MRAEDRWQLEMAMENLNLQLIIVKTVEEEEV